MLENLTLQGARGIFRIGRHPAATLDSEIRTISRFSRKFVSIRGQFVLVHKAMQFRGLKSFISSSDSTETEVIQ